MLCNLIVENYALISKLEIDFRNGLTTITGETGAGKSILLGALSLILGKRADTSVLHDKKKKCIVEGAFNISHYDLEPFFEKHNMDFEVLTTLRREISTAGKSRAFINDSPVTLEIITELGVMLIDIHSQYQTLHLANSQFQMKVIDSYVQNQSLLSDYQQQFLEFRQMQTRLDQLTDDANRFKSELDYFEFQHNQLESAKLKKGEQEELETELEKLNHAEEIKSGLTYTEMLLQGETGSTLQQLKDSLGSLSRIIKFMPETADLHQRIESAYIELKDIAQELDSLNLSVFVDPERLTIVRERLDLLYSLLQKHQLSDIADLIQLRENLQTKINEISTYDDQLETVKVEIEERYKRVTELANLLTSQRQKALQPFEDQVTGMLKELGIPNANFKILLENTADFNPWGRDKIQFLFTANKNTSLQEISKVASGGELSRLMLSIKSLMSNSTGLPTIIFDEIDTGVSGEIAEKVGLIIHRMAGHMQIINITHLPQIASKGKDHFLVFKTEDAESTTTKIKLLNETERHYEIARMLSGEEITDAALENARMLLKN